MLISFDWIKWYIYESSLLYFLDFQDASTDKLDEIAETDEVMEVEMFISDIVGPLIEVNDSSKSLLL